MDCLKLENRLADYLEGELPPKEVEELLSHVEECAACRAEFQAYQEQEERLTRFFQLKTERLEQLEQPTQELAAPVKAPRLIGRRYWSLAAAALLVLTVGYSAWLFRQDKLLEPDLAVAYAKSVRGAVQILEEGVYVPMGVDSPARQGRKIKVPVGGYLALELSEGSILEVRGGAQLALYEYRKRLEVEMNLGDIWLHQEKKSKKPVVVKTAHLGAKADKAAFAMSQNGSGALAHLTLIPPKRIARKTGSSAAPNTGAVFGVFEGLNRSIVLVAAGEVTVDAGGQISQVGTGETFISRADAQVAPFAEMTKWSHYPDRLKAFSLEEEKGKRPKLVPPVKPKNQQLTPPAVLSLVELLPIDARVLFSMRDCPQVLESFRQTDYAAVMNQETVRQWLATSSGFRAQQEIEQAAELLNQAAGLVQVLDGDLAFGLNPRGHFLLAADCTMDEDEIWEKVKALMLTVEEAQDAVITPEKMAEAKEQFNKHVEIANGRLIASNSAALLRQTHERLKTGKSSGFEQSAFHVKLLQDVTDPRLMIAVDLQSLIDEQLKQLPPDSPDVRLLNLLGFNDLDYLLFSPDFKGSGTDQAARLAFIDQRHGAANWLAEPAPMRGLNYFSPEVNFFAAAITRKPRTMFFDCLDLLDLEQDKLALQRLIFYFDQHEAFFDAFGNELVIGLDYPVLPLPNVKIIAEVRDREAAEAGLNELLGGLLGLWKITGQNYTREQEDYEGYTINRLTIDGLSFFVKPAWCFVDDYLIVSTSPQFIKSAIDTCARGDSIAQHSRLLDLLPGRPEKDFSLLVYQDIAKAVQDFSESGIGRLVGFGNLQLPASASSAERYRAASVAYACAYPGYIDLFMSTPQGIDLNMDVAGTMFSGLFEKHEELGETAIKCGQALTNLEQLRDVVMAFALEHNRPPASLDELVQPSSQYLESIPSDPFGADEGRPLLMRAGQKEGEIILYSIGPDGIDNRGRLEYKARADRGVGAGDIVIRFTIDR